jgi:hypothetical protein
MAAIDMAATVQKAMIDPEFSREMRFFDGAIKIGVDGEETVAQFRDGKLASAAVTEIPDSECRIVIRGTEEHWEKMLERYPVPFYQCLQTTSVKHGLQLSTTNETFAYLPALNRLVQILRNEKNEA